MSAGIDYGMGRSNIDPITGFRYGVISVHSISGDAWGDAEPIYPLPEGEVVVECEECETEYRVSAVFGEKVTCPECRHDQRVGDEEFEDYDHGLTEPIDYDFKDPDYDIHWLGESFMDLMVTRSSYFTRARFCSPCMPGAGSLHSPDPDGIETLCLGPDWFDKHNPCPYPIYRVADGSCIYTPEDD